ncbi:hypothetical protein [Nocardioides bruguierae]|uniref:hypothetical protein n=1 Tax=Nocardioides bruguierae TaxID=2945102 RepID=UPI00201FF70A|nr:hypothetical protein [Nocardioides bruguierae]MCL8026728.1 hypothetical protein [Nocardioides bruguierae]
MLTLLGALGFGALSAFVPVANAELFAVAAGRHGASVTTGLVLALAVGQTLAKVGLFEAARRGSALLARHRRRPSSRWATHVAAHLGHRATRAPLVLTAATVGLPPLMVVSVAAGATAQPRWEFGALVLVGRIARFSALAAPVALALG